jgi:hypothetical protein
MDTDKSVLHPNEKRYMQLSRLNAYVFFLKVIRDFQIKKYPATSCGGRHLVGNWLRASSPAQRPSPAGEGRWCYKMDNLFVGNPLMCRCAMIRLFEY